MGTQANFAEQVKNLPLGTLRGVRMREGSFPDARVREGDQMKNQGSVSLRRLVIKTNQKPQEESRATTGSNIESVAVVSVASSLARTPTGIDTRWSRCPYCKCVTTG